MSKFRRILVSNKGFTLIELLVVIAVLGILAAIAIPRLTGVTDKARISQAETALSTIKNAMEMHKSEYDYYPDHFLGSNNGGSNPDDTSYDDTDGISEYLDFASMDAFSPGNWSITISTSNAGQDYLIYAKAPNTDYYYFDSTTTTSEIETSDTDPSA